MKSGAKGEMVPKQQISFREEQKKHRRYVINASTVSLIYEE
jgi:hypothetical protein